MAGNRPFGDFLRSRRTRLNPDKVGDATRQRRRTPGLKREEVAQRGRITTYRADLAPLAAKFATSCRRSSHRFCFFSRLMRLASRTISSGPRATISTCSAFGSFATSAAADTETSPRSTLPARSPELMPARARAGSSPRPAGRSFQPRQPRSRGRQDQCRGSGRLRSQASDVVLRGRLRIACCLRVVATTGKRVCVNRN